MRTALGIVAAFFGLCAGCAAERARPPAPEFVGPAVTGVVFEDRNGNGVRDAGERGLPGVRVSNGGAIALTDQGGAYRLPVDDETMIFVIKPRGWQVALDADRTPRGWYNHKPQGSPALKYPGVAPTGPLPASVDFGLRAQREPERFEVLLFGDTQPRDLREVDYITRDVAEPLCGNAAAFALVLGDVVFDDLSVGEPLKRALGRIGVPMYYVMGNHDMDYQAVDDAHSDDVFERVFGPPYYSFDYGPVHFLVLEDVAWEGKVGKGGEYHGGIGAEQLEFVRNDLALTAPDQLVVILMHIPIMQIEERAELYRLLAARPHVVSFSGHNHEYEHWFLDGAAKWPGPEPHHHTTVGAVCGSWWAGTPDEAGIPHATMSDGTPNGWSILSCDGNEYAVEFRAARRPAEYQMSVHVPGVIAAAELAAAEVLVNVFAGSERSQVELRVDGGAWRGMQRVACEDPGFALLKAAEAQDPPPPGRKLPKAAKSSHIWRGVLPADLAPGPHRLEVRTTDVYGHVYAASRIVRVE